MLTITGYGWMNLLSDPIKSEVMIRSMQSSRDGLPVPVPPMIQMWMCFTNKGGRTRNLTIESRPIRGANKLLPWATTISIRMTGAAATNTRNAEQWQKDNDDVFIRRQAFADADMRMFAYTFGDRVLEKVWPYFYDSQEKYDRLRRIKGELDPDGLFSADEFSLKPL
jgi:hypothetical protein